MDIPLPPLVPLPVPRPGREPLNDRVGEETVAAVLHAFSGPYVAASILFGIGLVTAYLIFFIQHSGNLLAQFTLTLSGYFHPRPDPGMESVLRTAFAELDQELAAILGDRLPGSTAS